MKRYRKWHIGRLRIRAAEILNKCFPEWDVIPSDIVPASGSWRTDWRLDVYRWELYTRHRDNPNVPVVAGCWDTLTRFVRLAAKFGATCDDGVIAPNERAET